MAVLDAWLSDFPQQFRDKKYIEILIEAFAEQMDEIYEVFRQLDEETDLASAAGKNLDRVGDIAVLSRKDASYILRKASKEMTDDIYRPVLLYKSLINSTECTYYEIMDGMSMLWDTGNVEYKEDPDRPATILLSFNAVDVDGIDPTVGKILSFKAAGVALVYLISYMLDLRINALEQVFAPSMIITVMFPFWEGRYFNGTWPLDGSVLLRGIIYKLPVTAEYSGLYFKEADDCMETSVTLKKNLWYLDGSCRLDGNKQLNAAITEEVI